MPRYPTPSDYQEAVQFPDTAFLDSDLQDAAPDTNALGLPQPITGNFAAVFPMTDAIGRRWAVKCFLTEVEDQQTRYRAIDRHLDAHDVPQTVAFDYQERGIRVDGAPYPILKMEWIDGVPLNRFVAEHLDAPDTLQALAEQWRHLLTDLQAATIAHGDLQHGNVLVVNEGDGPTLRLVDYDTMYVPALSGRASAEVGHRNYQHPDRTDADFGPHLDRFAGLVIYTALHAVAARPALWQRYDTGENILFRADDFYDPSASPAFEALGEIDAIQPLVKATRTACLIELDAIPTLRDVRGGNVSAVVKARQAARSSRSIGAPSSGQVWALALVGSLLIAVVATGRWVNAWIATGLFGIGLAVLLGGGWMRYRQLPLVRRRRRLKQEISYFTLRIDRQERQIEALRMKKKAVRSSIQQRREERLHELRNEAIYDRLKYHFVGEARAIEGVTHKHVVRLKAAGLRTAYALTPDALQEAREIGEQTSLRLQQWRSALVEQYRDAIPTDLSPAEERRIQRYVAHRVDNLDAEVSRAREKMLVQEEERAQARERLNALPVVSFSRYLRYALGAATLPDRARNRFPSDEGPASRAPEPVPAPLQDDRPWWTQAGS